MCADTEKSLCMQRVCDCLTCLLFPFPFAEAALGLLDDWPEVELLGRSEVCSYRALRFGCSLLAPVMDT